MSQMCVRARGYRRWRPGFAWLLAAVLAAAGAGPSPVASGASNQDNKAKAAAAKKKPKPKKKTGGKSKRKKPTTQPATKPAEPVDPAKAARRAELVRMATDYLTKWYSKQLDSTDWMARAVATISVSRMPTADATETVLKRMDADRHPVCRLIAWQGALARANMLTDEQYQRWRKSTWRMIQSDLFHGDLRIALMEFLGSAPADSSGRAYFLKLFKTTNSLDSGDVPTLIAMGRCLRSWGDAQTVETLIRCLGHPSTAVRAELILQAAGAKVPWNRTPSAAKEYAQWWKDNKDDFTANPPKPNDWKKLRPQYLHEPVKPEDFDVLDMKWRHEMELKSLQLRSFGFVVALDCSRSMRAELDRLRRDILVMLGAFTEIARETGLGLTFFAPGGELKHFPLTDSQSRLRAILRAMDIFGPAGEEEWAGAIEKAMHANRWPRMDENARRVIVLVSDEPITGAQFARALPLCKSGAEYGFRLYGMRVQKLSPPNNPLKNPLDRTTGGSLYDPNNPLYAKSKGKAGAKAQGGKNKNKNKKNQGGQAARAAARGGWGHYDTLAEATGGRAIDVYVPQGTLGLGVSPGPGGGKAGAAKPNGMPIAPIFPGGGPTYNILTVVLTDVIGPGHSDRVEPLVKILVSYCQKAAARIPERRTWQRPGTMERNHESYK